METATAFPGNTGQIPNSVAPLAEILRLNGYSTARSVSSTRRRRGRSASPGRPIAGLRIRGSTSSTGSSAARPTSGAPLILTAYGKWIRRRTRRLSLHDGHQHGSTNQAIQLDPKPTVDDAGQAVLHVLRDRVPFTRRIMCRRNGRTVQGPSSTGLGQVSRLKLRAPEEAGRSCLRTPSSPANARRHQGLERAAADETKLFARQDEVFAGLLEHTDHEIGRCREGDRRHR